MFRGIGCSYILVGGDGSVMCSFSNRSSIINVRFGKVLFDQCIYISEPTVAKFMFCVVCDQGSVQTRVLFKLEVSFVVHVCLV